MHRLPLLLLAGAGIFAASDILEAGRSGLLRQAFVNRAGHCVFGTSELLAAIQTVGHRVRTGEWQDTSAEGSRTS